MRRRWVSRAIRVLVPFTGRGSGCWEERPPRRVGIVADGSGGGRVRRVHDEGGPSVEVEY